MPAVLIAAALSGAGAAALSPRVRTIATVESRWLSPFVYVPLAALAGAGAAALATRWTEVIAFGLLALASALLAVIDLAEHRLPDAIVGPTYPALLAALTLAAAVAGSWDALGRALLAAVILVAAYFVLWFVYPSGLGFGDVKLAGLLGLFLGWLGWNQVLLGTTAAFVLGGIFALGLLLGGRATRKTAFPFGPFMLAGAVVGAVWGAPALPAAS